MSPRAELALFECPACEKVLAQTLLGNSMQPSVLQRLDGKIAEAEFRISSQEQRVTQMRVEGRDARLAVDFLGELRRALENYLRIKMMMEQIALKGQSNGSYFELRRYLTSC